MRSGLPNFDLSKPNIDELIRLPYQKNILLCPQTKTRWIYDKGEVRRDLEGENEWLQMGNYVGKTYYDVFEDSYKYAMKVS